MLPEDEAELWAFLTQLSVGSRYLRFFGAGVDLRAEARLGAVSDIDHHGLLAANSSGGVVGHAVYVRLPHADRAEVAVVVADVMNDLGLATLMILRLAQFAEQRGITGFYAEVLPENRGMLAVLHNGFDCVTHFGDGALEVHFPTSGWRAASARLRRAGNPPSG